VPEQAPLHPAKVDGGIGFAVRVTGVFAGKLSVQSKPQSMPGGELVTVPSPPPLLVTVRGCGRGGLKVAMTDCA
jgi:hypothetical protein